MFGILKLTGPGLLAERDQLEQERDVLREERDQARESARKLHRRAQVAEAALKSRRDLAGLMSENQSLRWNNQKLDGQAKQDRKQAWEWRRSEEECRRDRDTANRSLELRTKELLEVRARLEQCEAVVEAIRSWRESTTTDEYDERITALDELPLPEKRTT